MKKQLLNGSFHQSIVEFCITNSYHALFISTPPTKGRLKTVTLLILC